MWRVARLQSGRPVRDLRSGKPQRESRFSTKAVSLDARILAEPSASPLAALSPYR